MIPEHNATDIFVKVDSITSCGLHAGFNVCIDGVEHHYPIDSIKFLRLDGYAEYVMDVLRKLTRMPKKELNRIFGFYQVQELITSGKFKFAEIEKMYEEWKPIRFGDIVTSETDFWFYEGICLSNATESETDQIPVLVLTAKRKPYIAHAFKNQLSKIGHVDSLTEENIKKYCSSKGKKHNAYM